MKTLIEWAVRKTLFREDNEEAALDAALNWLNQSAPGIGGIVTQAMSNPQLANSFGDMMDQIGPQLGRSQPEQIAMMIVQGMMNNPAFQDVQQDITSYAAMYGRTNPAFANIKAPGQLGQAAAKPVEIPELMKDTLVRGFSGATEMPVPLSVKSWLEKLLGQRLTYTTSSLVANNTQNSKGYPFKQDVRGGQPTGNIVFVPGYRYQDFERKLNDLYQAKQKNTVSN